MDFQYFVSSVSTVSFRRKASLAFRVLFCVFDFCEVLIGWRVRIHGLGEGIITAIRKRRLRSTLFSISGSDFLCLFAENICQGWMRDVFWKKFQSFGGLPIESEGSQSHEIPLKRQP